MKIGLMGFDTVSSNKGCEALTYACVNMVNALVKEPLQIHIFGCKDLGEFPKKYPDITFVPHWVKLKDPRNWFKLKRMFDQLDIILDVTYGDGFSDIYGRMWNVYTNLMKQIANMSKTPLVLMPQTYGPYKNPLLRKWAYHIVKKSAYAFSRDEQSAREMNRVIGEKVVATTDLAFALPFDGDRYAFDKNMKHVGINVSSLLWDGGHNIKLKVEYQKYCQCLIETYLERENTVIHLIPHVIDTENYQAMENDVRVCEILHRKFPKTVLAPAFRDPIDAKSYISQMDVFIGARMHSTIGSMSSGVPTIPFSYSKKFEGLFGNLDYPYVISATKIKTDEAVAQTKEYIDHCQDLEQVRKKSNQEAINRLDVLRVELKKLLIME